MWNITSLAASIPLRPDSRAPSDTPEDAFLNLLADGLHRLLKLRHELRSITLEVTRRCDLACRHCYMSATATPPKEELGFAELAGLGLSIRRTFGTRVAVAITGGEPLLRPDLIPLLRLYHTLGLKLSLSTNGLRLTREKAGRLAPLLSAIAVSLDGVRHGHEFLRGRGTFEGALRGLVTATKAGIGHVALKTAVHPENLSELPVLLAMTRSVGVSEWHLFPIEPLGRAASRPEILLTDSQHAQLLDFFETTRSSRSPCVVLGEQRALARPGKACRGTCLKRCNAGISSLAILGDGRVSACVTGARGEDEVEGDIRRCALLDIWNREFARTRAPGWRACNHHRFERPGSADST